MTQSFIISFGFNDLLVLQDGWYDLEKSPEGILFRAASPQADIVLPIKEKKIEVCFFVAARPEHSGKDLHISVLAEEKSRFDFSLETNGWTVRGGELELGSEGRIRLATVNPWSPDQLYGNGDVRSLGVLVSAIRLREMEHG